MSASKYPTIKREENALDYFSRTDERSLINLVPPAIQNAFLQVAQDRPDLLGVTERKFRDLLRSTSSDPVDPVDNRLRLKFWVEYDHACETMGRMNISKVFAGICSREMFYGHYLKNPVKMAWLLCPPTNYMVKMEEGLEFGLEQLRDILELSHIGPTGRPDVSLMSLKAKIVAMFDTRLNGAVVQKIEQKNMNLNVTTSNDSVAKHVMESTMEDLDRRLKELDKREMDSQNLTAKHQEYERNAKASSPLGEPIEVVSDVQNQ